LFTFSFCALLVLSIATLIGAIRGLVRQPDVSRFRLDFWMYSQYFIIFALTVVLVTRSSFSGRYVVLGLMVLSFLIDHWYNYRLSEANRTGKPVPRRRWWPVFDNTAWIVAVTLLYAA
jgi:hypothetical protein